MERLLYLLRLIEELPRGSLAPESAAVRRWLKGRIKFLQEVERAVPGLVDHAILVTMDAIQKSDDAWDLFWRCVRQRMCIEASAEVSTIDLENAAAMIGGACDAVEGALETAVGLLSLQVLARPFEFSNP